jgi:hypothetical protein
MATAAILKIPKVVVSQRLIKQHNMILGFRDNLLATSGL